MTIKNNEELTVDIKNDAITLESLILDGESTRIPVTFNFPTSNDSVPVNAFIKPINSVKWNNIVQAYSKDIAEMNVRLFHEGFLDENGEKLSLELIRKIPVGIMNQLMVEIQRASGITVTKDEQAELTRELMGF